MKRFGQVSWNLKVFLRSSEETLSSHWILAFAKTLPLRFRLSVLFTENRRQHQSSLELIRNLPEMKWSGDQEAIVKK